MPERLLRILRLPLLILAAGALLACVARRAPGSYDV